MADEVTDEVKVFRKHDDADDFDSNEPSTDRLDEDKKEAARETEFESRTGVAESLLGKGGAFKPAVASPCFPGVGFGFGLGAPLSPHLLQFPMFMPLMGQAAVAQAAYNTAAMAMGSPSFMRMPIPQSPSYNNYTAMFNAMQNLQLQMLASPGNYAAAMNAQKQAQVPLAPNMRPGALNQMTNMRVPPYGGMMPNGMGTVGQQSTVQTTPKRKERKKPHIKKPLNAFMWFMRENRPKLLEELGNKEKQSSEVNKELGKRWHTLSKDEQEKYFAMAKRDKEEHKQKYPEWSARENYAVHKKKKRKREKAEESGDAKKCRARFGMNAQERWCKYCKRKKKCMYSGGGGENSRSSSSTEPSLPGDGSHLTGNDLFGIEADDMKERYSIDGHDDEDDENASNSESDVDDAMDDDDMDDPTLTQQQLEAVSAALNA